MGRAEWEPRKPHGLCLGLIPALTPPPGGGSNPAFCLSSARVFCFISVARIHCQKYNFCKQNCKNNIFFLNCHHLGGLNTPLPSVPSRWADPLNPIFFLGRWRWVCAGETIGSADTPWRGFSCLLGTRSRDTIWTRQIDPLTAAFPSPKTVSPHRALQGSSILWVVGVPNISLRFCKKNIPGVLLAWQPLFAGSG